MNMQQSAGFTLVELTLFLALSSLLFLVAIIGTGNSIRSSRFTDSSRSLHAYIQKQYDNILNGVNSRLGQERCAGGSVDISNTQAPGTSNCLLLGRLITIKPNTSIIQSFDIVGTEPLAPDYSKPDETLIYDFQPIAVRNSGVDTYQIPWGAEIVGTEREIDSVAVDVFAMIRSPKSSRIISYTFKEPLTAYSLTNEINPSDASKRNNIVSCLASDPGGCNATTKAANFCLQSADRIGILSKLTATGGQGQASIQLAFNASPGECDGS